MGLAIVAIPEENDRVWKVSSEKVPHLTLLFLGDAESANLQQIMQFVEHAVTLSEHGPFYLDVDRRGVLGADEADVLFFNKRSWNLKWIKQFRGQLLQNDSVRTAYDSTEQFDEWHPHLTLGYPATPAKPMPDDGFNHPLYSVAFDRIAVWPGNYEGPEFRLEWPDRELEGDLAIAYSDAQKAALMHYGEEAIEHFGVKGMRWGQRKTETVTVGGKSKQVTPKKAAKLDKKWEKNIYSIPGAIAVHNGMAEHFNQRIGTINDKYKNDDFAKTNWNKPESLTPREKAYNKEVDALTLEGHQKAIKAVHGTSPTGKREAKIEGDRIVVHEVEVKHADDNATAVAVLKITRNSGLITETEPLQQEDSMAQTAELGEEFLEHYGKKGMRWGVRNERQRQTGLGAARRGAHAQKAQRLHKKADALERAANATKRDTLRRRSLNANATRARKQADAAQRIADGKGPGKAAAKKVASGAKKVGKGTVHVAKDIYFESSFGKDTATRTVAHAAAKNWAEKDVPRLNAQYKGTKGGTVKGRLKNPLAKETIEYRSRSRAAYRDRINEEVAKLPANASGNRRYEIHDNGKTNANYLWSLKAVDVKRSSGLDHAAKDEPVGLEDFEVRPTFDEDGFIIGFVQESSSTAEHGEAFVEGLVHGAADLGEAFILEHYGIKGMRWGRRGGEPTAVAPTATSKVPHGAKRKTQVEAKGGENHPATQDALKVETARVKLKKSGPKALSNQELREVAERLRLEQQAVQLDRSHGRLAQGRSFVKKLTGVGKDANDAINTGFQTAKLAKQVRG